MEIYDVIVLGAGIMGSAVAYYLARSAQRVLLLERFEVDHQKGSSYGYSRITRYAYDNLVYIRFSQAACPMWELLEQESGEKLYTRAGGLDFGRPDQQSSNNTIGALSEVGFLGMVLNLGHLWGKYWLILCCWGVRFMIFLYSGYRVSLNKGVFHDYANVIVHCHARDLTFSPQF
jgi:glycine/D-amino acid oxidase-like deaminating enzyme